MKQRRMSGFLGLAAGLTAIVLSSCEVDHENCWPPSNRSGLTIISQTNNSITYDHGCQGGIRTTETITRLSGCNYSVSINRQSCKQSAYKSQSKDCPQDSDGDGLSDKEEQNIYDTDPFSWDTDCDGLSDGEEVNTHNTDPLDSLSY